MKKNHIFLLVALFFIVTGGLFAQNAQELRFGTHVSGNLNSGAEIWYSLKPTESGFVIVEVTSEMDTYLEFFNAQRELLAEDDDGGEGYNAKLEIFAESGKTYYIKVRGYDSGDTGPFRVIATSKPLPAARDLSFGNFLSGTLSSGEEQWYRVRTTQAGLVTVETSGGVDTVMEVYNSSWQLLEGDDDSGEDYNARLEILTESNQSYYYKVRGYSSDDTGSYRILASFETIQTENNTERSRAITLRLGESFSVFLLSASESRWYVYNLTRSAPFVVQTRGNMDTLLFLYDSNGNQIADDDDSGEGNNAMVSQRLNPGTYYIEVRSYSGQGRCTLHAETR
jgi:hypothetical protein